MLLAISIAIDMRRHWRSSQESATEGHAISGSSTNADFGRADILIARAGASFLEIRGP
jgi:hypothetical protein